MATDFIGSFLNSFPLERIRERFTLDEGLHSHCSLCGSAFDVKRIKEGDDRFRLTRCVLGHEPVDIWENGEVIDQRQPGEDPPEDERPRAEEKSVVRSFVQQHHPHYSLEEVLAEPKARRYFLRDTRSGSGIMKAGEVFMLAARGGIGKSNALVQLGVSVGTGRPWFGSGKGWQPQEEGPVLGVLAEEDRDEALRRLQFAIRAAGIINPGEVQKVLDNFHLLPVKGKEVALCEPAERGKRVVATTVAAEILHDLQSATAMGNPYVALLLDPLADLSGPEAETDNAAGKSFVKILTRFTMTDCGSPTVGLTHHLRKTAKGDPRSDDTDIDSVRGSSSIVNAVRWVAVMDEKKEGIVLRVKKTNYGKRPEPMHLGKVDKCEGMLVAIEPPAPKESEDDPAKRDLDLENRLHDSIEQRGPDSGKNLAARLGRHQKFVNRSLGHMVQSGRLLKKGWKYVLPETVVSDAESQGGQVHLFPTSSQPLPGKK